MTVLHERPRPGVTQSSWVYLGLSEKAVGVALAPGAEGTDRDADWSHVCGALGRLLCGVGGTVGAESRGSGGFVPAHLTGLGRGTIILRVETRE